MLDLDVQTYERDSDDMDEFGGQKVYGTLWASLCTLLERTAIALFRTW
jgi:hypothetical protein